jgi:hypothetical protein
MFGGVVIIHFMWMTLNYVGYLCVIPYDQLTSHCHLYHPRLIWHFDDLRMLFSFCSMIMCVRVCVLKGIAALMTLRCGDCA